MGMCVAALLALGVPSVAGATNFVVNTTQDLPTDQDCTSAPNDCTIRDAFTLATGADTITLPAGTFNLSSQLGELDLTGATVTGAGARSTIIDGGDATRLLTTQNDLIGQTTVAPQISGVTFRDGQALGTATTNIGGAIQVSGTLGLANSAVLSSTAETDGGGIGLGSGADVILVNSTVAGNESLGGQGGGIFSANEGIVAVANSTISGNTADFEGGGIFAGSGTAVSLLNATIAANTGDVGGIQASGPTIRNTIIYGNSVGQCAFTGTVTANNSLAQDGTCGLSGNGSITGVNPGLGPVQNNGGPTDTRAIGPSSIAINHGGAGCQSTDQRGVARPQLGACDIGAYEYRSPHLTVIKRVVNDQGGTQKATDFKVHVRRNGADVGGSPKPGSSTGTTYSLIPGTYVVGEDSDSRYTAAISGSCAANGLVTLAEGQSKSCTITNSDKPPVIGKLINAEPEGGTVKVKPRGRKHFHKLVEGEQLPSGTIVDTRKGRIGLIAAANKNGGLAKADFFDGLFKLTQSKGKRPLTTLTLIEKLSCKGAGKATIAKKKKKKRRLWGDGKGRFRTKGQFSSATVRGTKWLVEDHCTSTLTRVKRGRVAVRDFVKHKTVIVKAGKRYTARKK
jgi:hypothetical protein